MSSLPDAVKNLVMKIFDRTQFEKTMSEMDLNLAEMPLGKLSKRLDTTPKRSCVSVLIISFSHSHLERSMGVLGDISAALRDESLSEKDKVGLARWLIRQREAATFLLGPLTYQLLIPV